MLLRLFERDFRATVFGEFGRLSQIDAATDNERIRLRSLDQVEKVVQSIGSPLIVAKPLVESQRAGEILDAFPGSRAVWMFRNYKDVVSSDLKKFSSQIANLEPIIRRDPHNWRSEYVSDEVVAFIRKYYSPTMPPQDAAALFWWARNRLFFDRDLSSRSDLMLCSYDELVSNPHTGLQDIYELIGMDRPAADITRFIHAGSVGLGNDVVIDDAIDEVCQDLTTKLNGYLT
jgi:hypothetical protein